MPRITVHYDELCDLRDVPEDKWPEIVTAKLSRILKALRDDVGIALHYANEIRECEGWRSLGCESFEEALEDAGISVEVLNTLSGMQELLGKDTKLSAIVGWHARGGEE